MNKLTYKEFERKINKMGYHISPKYRDSILFIPDNNDRAIATVSTTNYKVLSLDWQKFEELPDVEKDLIGNACWALASTPLSERGEVEDE